MDTPISFTLNGKYRTITTDPDRSLLEVLREDLHLTGTKFGCGEGECRACTVLVNGQSTPSCSTSIGDVDKQTVLTIEGLAHGDTLHPAQEAFLADGAFQCGYCTAGMIMGMAAVMKKNPKPTETEVLSELQKHICRCGSYAKYREAVRRVVASAQTGKARV
jgi:aerobic-type carbon monoxide dehydrogenase small subunit (CoxS/CutS family)